MRARDFAGVVAIAIVMTTARVSIAQEELPPIGGAPPTPPPASTSNVTPIAPTEEAPAPTDADLLPKPPPESPPQLPRKRGVVLEGALGALGFAGQFRHVAPAGPWMRLLLGYEPFRWLMVYGEGEMTFTDTSISQAPTEARAFPILGFGGGVRFTAHVTPRVALFLEGGIGAMKADVPVNALAIIGFRDAESFGVFYNGRIGVEWYQVDRHLAIGISGGGRDASNFASPVGASKTPWMWDGAATIRYTF